MIKVTKYVNVEDKIAGFKCSGHANYAEKGQDIVCSAVSSLVINTVNSIEKYTSDTFDYKDDEDSGIIDFLIQSDISNESELLLKSLFLGLHGIKDAYGEQYISINKNKIR